MRCAWWGISLLLAAAAGCARQPELAVDAVVTDRKPPSPRVESVGEAPARNLVWMGGHWSWAGGDYLWVPGQWVPVAAGYARWEPGRWIHTQRGWYFIEGHWR